MYFSAKFFVLIGLIVCLFAQSRARKRGHDELNGATANKPKQPLPFDLNEPAPIDDSDAEQINKKRRKSSYVHKARNVRDRKNMNEDSSFLTYRNQKEINLTEKNSQARKEARKIINHQQYLRRKAKYGSQTVKQRREIAEIKRRMKLGTVSNLDKKRVEDYYKKKRSWDKTYRVKMKSKKETNEKS